MKNIRRTLRVLARIAITLVVSLCFVAVSAAGILNPAPTARTGQATSYDAGDDGDLQEGVEWPDPRFTDNLDGTVTDHLMGLVWLKDATRFSPRGWVPALNACNNLAADGVDLTDGSAAGEWRLPNNKELRRLIDFGRSNPALPEGHPFIMPEAGSFWSSTTATNNTGRAWQIDDGTMQNDPKGTANLVWPVRDPASGGVGPAPVPRTGQTISYGPRDDGELQKGVEWPDPRFTDNSDGTVTDHLTGLIWLQDATGFADLSFADALEACNTLADDGVDLTDGSEVGQWRLSNIWELASLNDFSQIGPALPLDHPFIAGNAGTFWTSTTAAHNMNRAWTIGMGVGRVLHLPKGDHYQVWPVRGATPAPVDIKPGSCPNPLNAASKGKLPVAILGAVDFDVTAIDPVTIRLEGVAPIRSSIEDVAAPFEPYTGKEDCWLDCSEDDQDGWLDLTLKFSRQAIVAALGEIVDGECRVLTITGHLREEFGSTPLEGEDVVVILHAEDNGDGDDDDDDSGPGGGRRMDRAVGSRRGIAPPDDLHELGELKLNEKN